MKVLKMPTTNAIPLQYKSKELDELFIRGKTPGGDNSLNKTFVDDFTQWIIDSKRNKIKGLENFNDVGVLDYIIPILENSDNYEFYFDILDLAKNLDAPETYMNMIRNAAYKAMLNSTGENN